MRGKLTTGIVLSAACLLRTDYATGQTETPMGAAFTYQGHLTDGGSPADGTYDFQFKLCDDETAKPCEVAGFVIDCPVENPPVSVEGGLFTVVIDCGSDVFDGGARWLEMAVKHSDDPGFTTLSPRQELTPTPYALHALDGWLLTGNAGTDPEVNFLGTTDSQPLTWRVNSEVVGRIEVNAEKASLTPNVIFGYVLPGGNNVFWPAGGGTISGGGDATHPNFVYDDFGTIGGGSGNEVGSNDSDETNALSATVAGGGGNTASGFGAAICGGLLNQATGNASTVVGGINNVASAHGATVGGGGFIRGNIASGMQSTVSGGEENEAAGRHSMIPGGWLNEAQGLSSLAAGTQAKADHDGMFVWADFNSLDFPSAGEPNFAPAANQFLVRATGGVVMVSAINGVGHSTAGVELPAGGGAWAALSDRNYKANFTPIDGREILQRLSSVPVNTWNYKAQDPSVRHIGPTSQDFHAAFGLGESNRRITTIDADGVALAAIQGLHEIVKEREARIAALEARLATLEKHVVQAGATQNGGVR